MEECTENVSCKTTLRIRIPSTLLSEDLTGLVEKIVNSANNRNNEPRPYSYLQRSVTQGANEITDPEEGCSFWFGRTFSHLFLLSLYFFALSALGMFLLFLSLSSLSLL